VPTINVINKQICFQISIGVDECDSTLQNNENNASKTKHVLTELLFTERQYTAELGSILKVCYIFEIILYFGFLILNDPF